MPPSSNVFRAARPLFNQSAFTAHTRQAFARARFQRQQQQSGRRWQSTATGAGDAAHPSWIKRMWDSPIGLKTVHFWAPVMKWCLVIAGMADFARPAEKLSATQNVALTATGLIWTRWCLIIKPKNYLLAAVNFFLGIVGIVQVSRIVAYNQSKKKNPVQGAIEEVKQAAQS